MDLGLIGLTVEMPIVVDFKQDLRFAVNVVPKDYRSFFVTPAVRANLFPESGISPWVSVGGGVGYFNESSTLEAGGTNPGKTGTASGIFQVGGGLDVRLFRTLSLRGQVRDLLGRPRAECGHGKDTSAQLLCRGRSGLALLISDAERLKSLHITPAVAARRRWSHRATRARTTASSIPRTNSAGV
jgi:hypothetical protein